MSAFYEKLCKVSERLRVNRLSLNGDMTCYIIICNKKVEEGRIQIAGEVITRANKLNIFLF